MKKIFLATLLCTILSSKAAFFTDPNPIVRYTKAAIGSLMLPVTVGINSFHILKEISPHESTTEAGFWSLAVAGLAVKPWLRTIGFAFTTKFVSNALAHDKRGRVLLALAAACQVAGMPLQAFSDKFIMR